MTVRRSLVLSLVVAFAALFAFASPSGAVENPDYTAPPPAEVIERNIGSGSGGLAQRSREIAVAPAAAPAATAGVSSRQTLAITGSDMAGFAIIGTVLVAGGAGLLVLRRRVAV